MINPPMFPDFAELIQVVEVELKQSSRLVHSARWQGVDIASKPEMATHELKHVCFSVPMAQAQWPHKNEQSELDVLREQIKPNLPWADDHFLERVCGYPINPGTQWSKWPYGHSAKNFLDEHGKFNHNYMERYWPKYAGYQMATASAEAWLHHEEALKPLHYPPHKGIKYEYGDLSDVVGLLAEDPYTRQAYLPVWFPEDTGGGSKRAPCTIGYHFMMREGKLDLTYQIRSCDFVRHFRDDIYLTVRLALWVIQEAAKLDNRWKAVVPGDLIMSIQSLHLFRNDYNMLFR